MRALIFLKLLLAVLTPTAPVWAEGFSFWNFTPIKLERGYVAPKGIFLAGNEFHPLSGQPLFNSADPQTLYMSVGTVRGLVGAYLSNAGGVIHFDSDPGVTIFNQINAALLDVSENISDYRTLALNSTFSQWSRRKGQNSQSAMILTDPLAWQWWKQRFRDNPDFTSLLTPPDSWSEEKERPFKNVNPLYDQEIYQYLSRIAKAGRIWHITADLEDSNFIQKLVQWLKFKDLKIGSLDVSNAYPPYGLNPDRFAEVIKVLREASSPNARLVMYNFVSYVGYTFSKILVDGTDKTPRVFRRLEAGHWPLPNTLDDAPPSCEPILIGNGNSPLTVKQFLPK